MRFDVVNWLLFSGISGCRFGGIIGIMVIIIYFGWLLDFMNVLMIFRCLVSFFGFSLVVVFVIFWCSFLDLCFRFIDIRILWIVFVLIIVVKVFLLYLF